ncbi:hypothetical protein KO506_07175 [Polaribacter vadi]|uniref:hypothetical protein n=1 Tax=Polaribacter TaxID=52959 RepID=UPI001C087080|nr:MULTISPECIES: hypothetical protein [Polaribacter]MBU3011179.1 hypothetical protein [Polaribacter vadi]MDO6740993.1 hypothetical protein [Polaribacter sp. 1_MG-2023]
MKLIEITYRTLSGTKKVLKIPKRKSSQWIIYQDNKPKYYVDLYDLSNESNSMMNSLVLCAKRSMNEVLKMINKKHNINLSTKNFSSLAFAKKKESKVININLELLPEEWLDYSL